MVAQSMSDSIVLACSLDDLMLGGFREQQVTEITGDTASGKTQVLLAEALSSGTCTRMLAQASTLSVPAASLRHAHRNCRGLSLCAHD
jgi:predicted ATP-dependent serine protease